MLYGPTIGSKWCSGDLCVVCGRPIPYSVVTWRVFADSTKNPFRVTDLRYSVNCELIQALQTITQPVAAICHKSWGSRSRPPLFLRQSSFLPFPLVLSKGSGQSTLTRCQTFWCNLCSNTALYNRHWYLMYYPVQKSACMESSAIVGRTDRPTMD